MNTRGDASSPAHREEDLDDAELMAVVAELERHAISPPVQAISPPVAAAAGSHSLSLYEELLRYQEEHADEAEALLAPEKDGGTVEEENESVTETRHVRSDSNNSEDDRKPAAFPTGVFRQPLSRGYFTKKSNLDAVEESSDDTPAMPLPLHTTSSEETFRHVNSRRDFPKSVSHNQSVQLPAHYNSQKEEELDPELLLALEREEEAEAAKHLEEDEKLARQLQEESPIPESVIDPKTEHEILLALAREHSESSEHLEEDEKLARMLQDELNKSLPSSANHDNTSSNGESLDEEEELLRQLTGGPPIVKQSVADGTKVDTFSTSRSGNDATEDSAINEEIEQQRKLLENYQKKKQEQELADALRLSSNDAGQRSKDKLVENWLNLRKRQSQPQPSSNATAERPPMQTQMSRGESINAFRSQRQQPVMTMSRENGLLEDDVDAHYPRGPPPRHRPASMQDIPRSADYLRDPSPRQRPDSLRTIPSSAETHHLMTQPIRSISSHKPQLLDENDTYGQFHRGANSTRVRMADQAAEDRLSYGGTAGRPNYFDGGMRSSASRAETESADPDIDPFRTPIPHSSGRTETRYEQFGSQSGTPIPHASGLTESRYQQFGNQSSSIPNIDPRLSSRAYMGALDDDDDDCVARQPSPRRYAPEVMATGVLRVNGDVRPMAGRSPAENGIPEFDGNYRRRETPLQVPHSSGELQQGQIGGRDSYRYYRPGEAGGRELNAYNLPEQSYPGDFGEPHADVLENAEHYPRPIQSSRPLSRPRLSIGSYNDHQAYDEHQSAPRSSYPLPVDALPASSRDIISRSGGARRGPYDDHQDYEHQPAPRSRYPLDIPPATGRDMTSRSGSARRGLYNDHQDYDEHQPASRSRYPLPVDVSPASGRDVTSRSSSGRRGPYKHHEDYDGHQPAQRSRYPLPVDVSPASGLDITSRSGSGRRGLYNDHEDYDGHQPAQRSRYPLPVDVSPASGRDITSRSYNGRRAHNSYDLGDDVDAQPLPPGRRRLEPAANMAVNHDYGHDGGVYGNPRLSRDPSPLNFPSSGTSIPPTRVNRSVSAPYRPVQGNVGRTTNPQQRPADRVPGSGDYHRNEVGADEDVQGMTREELVRKGQRETQQAIMRGESQIVRCQGCQNKLQVPLNHPLVYCPTCGVVSPCPNR